MKYQLINPPDNNLSIIEQVFANRGMTSEFTEHYLNTTDQDLLNPLLLDNMRQGAEMLTRHIANGDRIFLQVDCDCDGYTSAALFINYLNCLFPSYVQNNIAYRLHEGKKHGLILDTIPKDVKLVVVPDASSNDYEIHQELAAAGIDVLVLDHHDAPKVSEYACVINNQLCDYPSKSLSGVGIVYKFCSYIDKLLGVNYASNFVDLVALGMIADMVDLREYEVRHLITLGLNKITNPYFKGMVNKNEYSLKGTVTPFGVSFYIAPYINAITRMGAPEEQRLLFESMLDHLAYELIPSTKRGHTTEFETRVEQACRTSANIKNRQNASRDKALEFVESVIESQDLSKNKILVIKIPRVSQVDKNLTGLIANQLMAKYQKPILLMNETYPEDELIWMGSARCPRDVGLNTFKDFLADTNLIYLAEGHQLAFGVGIRDKDLEKFITFTNEVLKDYNFIPCHKVDFIFNGADFKSSDVFELAELNGYWGQGIEEPKIVIENLKIHSGNVQLMSPNNKPTLKFQLSNGVELIKFKSSAEEFAALSREVGCLSINVLGTCSYNEWMGTITPQILVEDYEIVNEIKYYF